MKFIRDQVLKGQLVPGGWCSIGSSLTVEIAGLAGFDWVLIDIEHGSGDLESLLGQLQALSATAAAGIVRIAWNEAPRFKRVLDMGASGVMVPYINSANEAKFAVKAMQYPPEGIRGVAKSNRGSGFGVNFNEYFAKANDNLLTVVQIETREAVKNADEIAAVDGVDVLFVGPLDLSVNMGMAQQFDHPDFQEALSKVVSACKKSGKAAGILLGKAEQVEGIVEKGFTFIALSTDGAMVAAGMKKSAETLNKFK